MKATSENIYLKKRKHFLDRSDIPLIHCRGLSSDNAANMSGKYEGFQAQTNLDRPFLINVVGVNAVESCLEAINFIFAKIISVFLQFTSKMDTTFTALRAKSQ